MNSAEFERAAMLKRRSRGPSATPPAATGDAEGAGRTLIESAIGRGLKAMFDDVIAEPVPDRFRQLLEELERKSGKK